MNATTPVIDYSAIKTRQQATWASGDYSIVGVTLQIVGEQLCEAANVKAGERVLDVAAGNGNASLAAARRWADVTSTDYVRALLDRGAERAAAERLPIQFEDADVENLPFADESFDAVLSTFGVMFAPNQERSAKEMLRVCRTGGRIGMANWTPTGFIGELFRIIGKHTPPPAGLRSPSQWGNDACLQELFDGHRIHSERKHFNFRYRSATHFLDIFKSFYGPTHRAFASLDAEKQDALEADIRGQLDARNIGGDKSLIVPSEYLEIVVTKS